MMKIVRKFNEWKLNREQSIVVKMLDDNDGELSDEILDKQLEINARRNELDLPDKSEIVNDEGFVQ